MEALVQALDDSKQPDMTAKMLANHLGLVGGRDSFPGATDAHRSILVLKAMLIWHRKSRTEQRFPIACEFAAKYLPALIDKLLNMSHEAPDDFTPFQGALLLICNAYTEVLLEMQTSAYLFKYLVSKTAQARHATILPVELARRIVILAPYWDEHVNHPPGDRVGEIHMSNAWKFLTLFSTILILVSKDAKEDEILPPDVRKDLEPWLTKWLPRRDQRMLLALSSPCFQHIVMMIYFMLFGSKLFRGSVDKKAEKAVQAMRRRLKGSGVCGMHGCEKKQNLKACSRCYTVQYCSPEHQKAHWNHPDVQAYTNLGHRNYCFKTVY